MLRKAQGQLQKHVQPLLEGETTVILGNFARRGKLFAIIHLHIESYNDKQSSSGGAILKHTFGKTLSHRLDFPIKWSLDLYECIGGIP